MVGALWYPADRPNFREICDTLYCIQERREASDEDYAANEDRQYFDNGYLDDVELAGPSE